MYEGSKDWTTPIKFTSVFGTEMNGTQTNNLTYSGIFIGDYRELNIINPNLIPSKKRISRKRFLYKSFFFLLPENFYQTIFF